MEPGDIYYVGSMGINHGNSGFPVLIISISRGINDADGPRPGGSCYGLINGRLRWYRCKDLKTEKENNEVIKRSKKRV